MFDLAYIEGSRRQVALNTPHYIKSDSINITMVEMMLLAVAAVAVAGVLCLAPRCPECGFFLATRNPIDPGLLICQRCRAIYEPGGRH